MDLRELMYYVMLTLSLLTETNAQTSCETQNGNKGECVSIYDCPGLLQVLKTLRLTPKMIAGLRRLQCGNGPWVCCERNKLEETKDQKIENVRQNRLNGQDHPNQIVTPSNNEGNLITICGFQGHTTRIVGGSVTELNEFPWMALLDYEHENGTWISKSGGFLINARYVITAAHCVVNNNIGKIVNVRIGEHDTRTDPDCINDGSQEICNNPVLNYGIEEIIPHKDYIPDNPLNLQNDIALIRLTSNVRNSEFVAPICLPPPDFPGTPLGNNVTVAGWGKTENEIRSPVKKKVDVPIVSYERCIVGYAGLTISNDLQICAGGEIQKDSCYGDSGGPLMTQHNGVWIAEGIVSFGPQGCGSIFPAVYTRVAPFVPWILTNMKP
ncbi:CLIP domain-containing serine protease B10-like [Phlebotomus papatasi]|uniref:CLIP domain-containing serine protease B10-like n=1 Tax=Phlebotomus papatasi TaxID=29031 RepID=UPI00248371D0|nr:CLIP domain-containing serine protease B10-like [Phlebotomus papatasi]